MALAVTHFCKINTTHATFDSLCLCFLTLLHNNLNYRVLGCGIAAIFLANGHSVYAPITSDECHA